MDYLDVDELIRAYDLYGPSALDSVINDGLLNESNYRERDYYRARERAFDLSRIVDATVAAHKRGEAPLGKLDGVIKDAFREHWKCYRMVWTLFYSSKNEYEKSLKDQPQNLSLLRNPPQDKYRKMAEDHEKEMNRFKLTAKKCGVTPP